MSTNGLFRLISNEGRAEAYYNATTFLNQRYAEVRQQQALKIAVIYSVIEIEDLLWYITKTPNCPICFEQLNVSKAALTDCNHIFCKTCIHAAFTASQKKSCPMCRHNITVLKYTREY